MTQNCRLDVLASLVAVVLLLVLHASSACAADPYASAEDWQCTKIAAELTGQNDQISEAAERLPSCAGNYRTLDGTLEVQAVAGWLGLCHGAKGQALALLRDRQRVLEGCRLRGSAR